MDDTPHPFPIARWLALAWVLFFVPYSWAAHGGWNLFFFCDVGVILTCLGIFSGSALLISSQAVAVMVVQFTWTLDLVVRLCGGHGVIPGPNWMLNPAIPLLFRIVSLYHAVWPVLLLWCLMKTGYDRRAFALASSLALILVSAGRLAPRPANVNDAYDLFGRSWQPGWLHVGVVVIGLIVIVYWPTHFLLRWIYGQARVDGIRRNTGAWQIGRPHQDDQQFPDVHL